MKTRRTRAELEAMLADLARKPISEDQMIGAMCYSVAPPKHDMVDEYYCPVCLKITLYRAAWLEESFEPSWMQKKFKSSLSCLKRFFSPKKHKSNEREHGRKPLCSIDSVPFWRNLVRTLNEMGVDISFDESTLCGHCRPDAKKPIAFSVLRFADVSELITLRGDRMDDLQQLLELLQGKLEHHGSYDGSPLQNHIPEIRELLGLDPPRQRPDWPYVSYDLNHSK